MDVRDLFLDQHAAMHSAAMGGNKMSAAERAFAGLTDGQMRVRPREANGALTRVCPVGDVSVSGSVRTAVLTAFESGPRHPHEPDLAAVHAAR